MHGVVFQHRSPIESKPTRGLLDQRPTLGGLAYFQAAQCV
jgi:hypothetical protein